MRPAIWLSLLALLVALAANAFGQPHPLQPNQSEARLSRLLLKTTEGTVLGPEEMRSISVVAADALRPRLGLDGSPIDVAVSTGGTSIISIARVKVMEIEYSEQGDHQWEAVLRPDEAWADAADVRAVVERLQELADEPAEVSAEQRAARLAGIADALAELRHAREVVQSVQDVRRDTEQKLAREKLEAALIELEKLRAEVMTIDAERQAIGQAAGQVRRPPPGEQQDAVARRLNELVEVRREALEEAKQLFESGVIQAAELTEAREALLEAEIRLVERQHELSKGGAAEILERLNQQMLELDVERSLTLARLQAARRMVPPELDGLDDAKLDQLVDLYGALAPRQARVPVLGQLDRRQVDLLAERLGLLIEAVEVVEQEDGQQH